MKFCGYVTIITEYRLCPRYFCSVIYEITIEENEFNGNTSIQLNVIDCKLSA